MDDPDATLEAAWQLWLNSYLDLMSRGSAEPFLVRIAAERKAEEFYKPVFTAGFWSAVRA